MGDEGEVRSVVIDNGSATTKAGIFVGLQQKDCYLGDEAVSKRGILNLRYPVEHGLVVNWDNMERLWHHSFSDELHAAPEEHPMLLTETFDNPRESREKAFQIVFETFSSPALYLGCAGALDMYASGRTTGLAVSLGHGATQCVPVYQGHAVRHAGRSMNDVNGRDLTDNLMKMLIEQGFALTTTAEREYVREIKETLCYVALDFDKAMESAAQSSSLDKYYELPRGNGGILVRDERIRCAEAYFQPSLMGLELPSLPQIMHQAIEATVRGLVSDDLPTSEASYFSLLPNELLNDVQSFIQPVVNAKRSGELYGNIVISGGSSMFPGIADRLQQELSSLALRNIRVGVCVPANSMFSTWIGGSMLASLSTFESMCVSKQLYDECGPSVIRSHCF